MSVRVSKKQAQRIIKRVCKKFNVKMVDSTKWYRRAAKRAGEKWLTSIGLTQLKKELDRRFMFYPSPTGGGILLCPRKLGASKHQSVRWVDLSILAHEMTHAMQAKQLGFIRFESAYGASQRERMRLEVEAECSEADVMFLLTGKYAAAANIFDQRWADLYMVNESTRRKAVELYEDRVKERLDRGRYCEPVGQYVCKVIQEELKR